MSICGTNGRFFGPVTHSEASDVTDQLMGDKNIEGLIFRFLVGDVELQQAAGEFQILAESAWMRLFGPVQKEGLGG